MAMFIVKPWYRKKDDAIYGAEWAGTSDPSWTRTDAAVGFSNPNPYYAGMSTTPSSPFDNIMPWSGIRRVTDANAGELVEIPKFYYKWTRDGVKMKLQISMSQFDGSHVSPAHADRGDGVGERDYVYVGRYHCASDYKSKTGVTPKVSTTRSTFRSGIHNLGNNVWQNDFAMRWTVNMLYLVEYAHWNSQGKIGWGGGTDSLENNGHSDTMPYHTGTIKAGRDSSNYAGAGIQYRYIENWWAGAYDWCDGVYFSGSNIYCIKNPANFSDSIGGTLVGTRSASNGIIKTFTNPTVTGFEYALYPSDTYDPSESYYEIYVCDGTWPNGTVLDVGGGMYRNSYIGAFFMDGDYTASSTNNNVGSRLMVLPPSRLSA